jgi:hypothetical protein
MAAARKNDARARGTGPGPKTAGRVALRPRSALSKLWSRRLKRMSPMAILRLRSA